AGESRVLFGLRHTGGGNAFFAGEIEEARLYDRALTAAEVAASARAAGLTVPLERVLAAWTPEQRRRRETAVAEVGRLREELKAAEAVPVAYLANAKAPDPTFVLLRGDVEKKGEQVTAGALSAVKTPNPDFGLPPDAPEGERRRKLAAWIASP